MPYEVFVRRRILSPIGMTDTDFIESGRTAGVASGYVYRNGVIRDAPARDPTGWATDFGEPAGGLGSTTRDLLKWDRALSDDRLLNAVLESSCSRHRMATDSVGM